jgi:hypothetical protein
MLPAYKMARVFIQKRQLSFKGMTLQTSPHSNYPLWQKVAK